MKTGRARRTAVAPVLATLMMIAVAVAMSVIIFVWSQGFLSQTSTAAGGQQSQQNVAAQSGISIESALFDTSTNTITMEVRDVGSVSVSLGSLVVSGSGTNSHFKAADVCTTFTAAYTSKPCTLSGESVSASAVTIAKSAAVTIVYSGTTAFVAGDLIDIKISTTVGTFATQTFTVP